MLGFFGGFVLMGNVQCVICGESVGVFSFGVRDAVGGDGEVRLCDGCFFERGERDNHESRKDGN